MCNSFKRMAFFKIKIKNKSLKRFEPISLRRHSTSGTPLPSALRGIFKSFKLF
jgi:hypothetical protein